MLLLLPKSDLEKYKYFECSELRYYEMHNVFVYVRQIKNGFTLIELMIALAIIAVLASVGYPAYSQYMTRSRVADGVGLLSSLRLLAEQKYQDDRTYATGGVCTIAVPVNKHFTFVCDNVTATTYTWTASNKDDVGLGAADNYVFSIDQDGLKRTETFAGATIGANCWHASSSSTC